jgi:SAM-dependent methyltransferase
LNERSIHISYKKNYRINLFKAYYDAIIHAAQREKKLVSEMSLLDIGCGRGEFLHYVTQMGMKNIEGVDFDPVCVKMSSQYAKCYRADITELGKYFKDSYWDIVLLSHIIEHLRDPISVIDQIKRISKFIIIAVPNPIRPNVLCYAIKRYEYSNKGHFYCWDRSHFNIFLDKCGLNIISYFTDDILLPKILPFKFIRVTSLGNKLEKKILPKYLPYFSTSLIALCEVKVF